MVHIDKDGAIDAELAQFLTSHLSIHLAACEEPAQTTLVRAVGCRVSVDRRHISVLFPGSQAIRLQQSVQANGRVAVVFSDPQSHRTLQFKGVDAVVTTADDQDRQSLAPYLKGFSARLQKIDVPATYVYALCHCDPDDLMKVTFSPLNIYQQTPGQQAGQAMV